MTKNTQTPVESSSTGSQPMLSRRSLLKAGAGAAAGATVLSGADVGPLDVGPVGNAEAMIVTGGFLGPAGWLAGVFDIFGSNAPPDGLGPDALQTQIYQAAKKRKSVNQSTFIDNRNIIKYIPEAAFSEAKLAALDAIKNGATQSTAISKGQQAANQHFGTIEENFLKSWNASCSELDSFLSSVSGSSLSKSTVFSLTDSSWNGTINVTADAATYTLRSGADFTIQSWSDYQGNYWAIPVPASSVSLKSGYDTLWGSNTPSAPTYGVIVTSPAGSTVQYLNIGEKGWNNVWTDMQNTFDTVLNNVSKWVSNVYDQIQTGQISPSQYLSATDLANMIAQDKPQAQAIANLIVLNIPGDYDNEVTVKLLNDSVTMKGYLATTDTTNVSGISKGTKIDPQATNSSGNPLYGTWYLAYRPGTYIESWSAFDSSYGVQGGTVRFTKNPKSEGPWQLGDDYAYVVETTAGESATVKVSAFTKTTANGTTYWTVDLSDQLNTLTTEIKRVRRIYVGDKPNVYRTRIVKQPFKVTAIEGSASSLAIQQQREPQTDSNYITEKQWLKFQKQRQTLIDRFEDAKASGGAGGAASTLPDLGIVPNYIPGQVYMEYALVLTLAGLGVNIATS